MKNDLYIQILYLPHCINVFREESNPYIGMQGWVRDFDGKTFDLFTGTSLLTSIKLNKCKFKIKSEPK